VLQVPPGGGQTTRSPFTAASCPFLSALPSSRGSTRPSTSTCCSMAPSRFSRKTTGSPGLAQKRLAQLAYIARTGDGRYQPMDLRPRPQPNPTARTLTFSRCCYPDILTLLRHALKFRLTQKSVYDRIPPRRVGWLPFERRSPRAVERGQGRGCFGNSCIPVSYAMKAGS